MAEKIKGGYILLSRRIIDSEIWKKPPAYLKIWIYILSKVCWKETRKNPVGQELFNFRQEKIPGVTLNQIYEFLRWAKSLNPTDSTTQITTQKTTRGIYLKVTKYEYYQDPNNYILPTQKPTEKTTAPQHYKRIINNSTINSINLSLSTEKKERDFSNLSQEEIKLLKKYAKKNGARNQSAYVRKLIDNGDYLNILQEEKQKQAQKAQKRKEAAEQKKKEQEEMNQPQEVIDDAFKKARENVEKNLRRKRG